MNRISEDIIKNIEQTVKGNDTAIKKILAAMAAGGHILLEDVPGVGKTTIAKTIAETFSLDYRRIQFTPDVLPSDITGFSMYDKNSGDFRFCPGAVFTNLLLADEINRTSPKTQSALLESMEEGTVTTDGITRDLPDPFTVIATENPFGASGTQALPDSQLDRFMIRLSLGYPSHDAAIEILKENGSSSVMSRAVSSPDGLKLMQKETENVYTSDEILDYIVSITEATRTSSLFSSGASTRGALSLMRMAKGMAYINGKDFVTPEEVQSVIAEVLGHRIRLSREAAANGFDIRTALSEILKTVPTPGGIHG